MLALLPVLSLLAAVRAQGAFDASANDVALVEARFEGEHCGIWPDDRNTDML